MELNYLNSATFPWPEKAQLLGSHGKGSKIRVFSIQAKNLMGWFFAFFFCFT